MTCRNEKHHRRSIRLRDFDYSSGGAYFVTICTFQRECLFGEIMEGLMQLNDMGRMVEACQEALPHHFPDVVLDEWVIMPNHIHGIIVIHSADSPVGATHASPDVRRTADTIATHASPGPGRRSIGALVGSFKSAASRQINQWRNTPGIPIWQRNYYERVIRDDRELDAIRQYIADNPVRWFEDENNPINKR